MITMHSDPFKELLDTFFEYSYPTKVSNTDTKLSKNENDYKVVIPVPGLTKDDLVIKIKDGILKISHVMKETDEETYSFVRSFEKSYRIPEDVEEKNIKGSVENGVLQIVLPKNKKKNSERLVELV